VVDGTCLENKRGETYREFESRPLRQTEDENGRIYYGRFLFLVDLTELNVRKAGV
jgi:hypothetical protein